MEHYQGHTGVGGPARCFILKRASIGAGTFTCGKREVGSSQGLAAAGWLSVLDGEGAGAEGILNVLIELVSFMISSTIESEIALSPIFSYFLRNEHTVTLNLKGHFLERIKSSLFFQWDTKDTVICSLLFKGAGTFYSVPQWTVHWENTDLLQEGIFTGILNICFLDQGTRKRGITSVILIHLLFSDYSWEKISYTHKLFITFFILIIVFRFKDAL